MDVVISQDEMLSVFAKAAIIRFKEKLEGYSSPLDEVVTAAFKQHELGISKAIHGAVGECVNSPDFQKHLVDSLNHKLANLVISKCSGLVEKSFNNLMQDQALRARLQMAVVDLIEKNAKGAA